MSSTVICVWFYIFPFGTYWFVQGSTNVHEVDDPVFESFNWEVMSLCGGMVYWGFYWTIILVAEFECFYVSLMDLLWWYGMFRSQLFFQSWTYFLQKCAMHLYLRLFHYLCSPGLSNYNRVMILSSPMYFYFYVDMIIYQFLFIRTRMFTGTMSSGTRIGSCQRFNLIRGSIYGM